ncbi:hypothetical protein Dimus_039690 [Dionaea muscipula]
MRKLNSLPYITIPHLRALIIRTIIHRSHIRFAPTKLVQRRRSPNTPDTITLNTNRRHPQIRAPQQKIRQLTLRLQTLLISQGIRLTQLILQLLPSRSRLTQLLPNSFLLHQQGRILSSSLTPTTSANPSRSSSITRTSDCLAAPANAPSATKALSQA